MIGLIIITVTSITIIAILLKFFVSEIHRAWRADNEIESWEEKFNYTTSTQMACAGMILISLIGFCFLMSYQYETSRFSQSPNEIIDTRELE